jgi:hypothetical protein
MPPGEEMFKFHGYSGPCPTGDPIVGHKTFSDGHHEPIRQSEAAAIMAASDAAKALRARRMPDERAAIDAMFEAWLRLKELGWKEAQYCPKDGSRFDVIEPGSTGIHRCRYEGEWPKGSWWIEGDGDLWPSRPVLFRVPAVCTCRDDSGCSSCCSVHLDVAQSAATTPEEPPANSDSSTVGSLSLDVRTLREAADGIEQAYSDSWSTEAAMWLREWAARLSVQEPRRQEGE